MPKTLIEYWDWLKERKLLWPAPPPVIPVNATPSVKPIEGIRAVTWNIYGTLLRITDGELLFQHPQSIRMEVAFEKTIHEFNMWNSMTRRPGKPADLLLPKYANAIEDSRLTSGTKKGDFPEVDSARIWGRILGMLNKKEYHYDESLYGDMQAFAQKVAFFFHSSLQGTEAAPNALVILNALGESGIRQAALADAQCFTMAQLTQALRQQGTIANVGNLLSESLNTLSYESGIRKPSPSLYSNAVSRFKAAGIEANKILHVGTRLQDDLAIAKACGMRTVLYAADKTSLQATAADLKNQEIRPDRMITDLKQLRDILQV